MSLLVSKYANSKGCDSLSRFKSKTPNDLSENDLASFIVEGRDGAVFVFTATDDGFDLYNRKTAKTVWRLIK